MGPLCSSFLGAFLGLALLLAGSDPRLSSHAVGELSVDSFDQSFPTLSLEWEDSYKLLHFQVHMISVGHGLTVVVSSEIFQVCRLFLVPLTKKLLITVTHHYHCCPSSPSVNQWDLLILWGIHWFHSTLLSQTWTSLPCSWHPADFPASSLAPLSPP